jgi:signal transduction histidine kinase
MDLSQLIQTTVDRVRQKIRDKEIDLHIDVDDPLPMVNADVDKIGWVLMQLLDNALKFTPNGGNVKIEARGNSSTVRVAVMDTGIGIPNERIEEIFEPFHQLDSSTTRRYSGTGLGLAMAHRILNEHGSNIEVESVESMGSRFQFSLPITTKNNAFTLESN